MSIEQVKRLPDSNAFASNAKQDLRKNAGTDAGQQVAESANHVTQSQSAEQQKKSSSAEKLPVEATEQDVNAAIGKLKDYVQNLDRELQFQVDKDTGKTVVKILDADTNEVVRQIPSEEVLELTKHLDNVQGVIFNSEA
ncbi:MAG: flagellar protein FlaG [Gammaproteobacteria bacterium]|nr:flagellar protein FlaG [Gammaproteobacteria bacterium]